MLFYEDFGFIWLKMKFYAKNRPFSSFFLCNGQNGPILVVFGIKLHFLPHKSKIFIKYDLIFIKWEKIWDKNFGPKGHPWGHWGPYLGGDVILGFHRLQFLVIWGRYNYPGIGASQAHAKTPKFFPQQCEVYGKDTISFHRRVWKKNHKTSI